LNEKKLHQIKKLKHFQVSKTTKQKSLERCKNDEKARIQTNSKLTISGGQIF